MSPIFVKQMRKSRIRLSPFRISHAKASYCAYAFRSQNQPLQIQALGLGSTWAAREPMP
jgi:hypothetical protein